MRASHPLLLSSQPAGSSEAGDPNVWESGGVSRAGSHPEEKPTAPPVLSRTQACTGTPEHLHLTQVCRLPDKRSRVTCRGGQAGLGCRVGVCCNTPE